MPLHFLSFFKFKLRDVKWSVMFTVIIMASVLSWLVSFSMSSNIKASVNNYSKTLTFIRVNHYVQGPGINDYAIIPSNVTDAIESLQHVKKLHKLYMFYIARVVHNTNVSGVPFENLTLFLMDSAIALGLSETIPPFIIDIQSGHLPINESEIAITGPGNYYKLGDEIEVAFNGTITKVKISGFLTTSLLSPVQMVVHKDFLSSMPGGDRVIDEALKGECTVLFVEVDDIYNVDEVLKNLRELLGLEGEDVQKEWEIRDVYEITYDEYLLKKTLELSESSAFITTLLASGALSFSIILIMITSYFNINIRKWEVGLLRSFGLSNIEIITAYILYLLAVTVLGIVAAFSVAHIMVTSIEKLLIDALGFGKMISAVTIELTPLTMLLTFTLAIVIGAASTFIMVSMALRKPVEDQLREF